MSRPRLALVAAVGPDGVIGRGGELPWRLPEDLRHFKQVTLGHAVIMGRRTWESIGRPLPNRRNIVVTRRPKDLRAEGCDVVGDLWTAINLARETDPEPMVIGGAEIYRQALPLATRIHLTEVDVPVEGGDAFFPPLDPGEWREVSRRTGETPGLSFLELERVEAAPQPVVPTRAESPAE